MTGVAQQRALIPSGKWIVPHVAIEAAVKVTTRWSLRCDRSYLRLCERTGCNLSKRRVGLENLLRKPWVRL